MRNRHWRENFQESSRERLPRRITEGCRGWDERRRRCCKADDPSSLAVGSRVEKLTSQKAINLMAVESWNSVSSSQISWLNELHLVELNDSRLSLLPQSSHFRFSFCLCSIETIIAIVSHFRISVRLCVGVTLSGNVRYFVRVSGALSRGLIHIWLSFISYLRRRSRRSQSSQSNIQSRLALEVSCSLSFVKVNYIESSGGSEAPEIACN